MSFNPVQITNLNGHPKLEGFKHIDVSLSKPDSQEQNEQFIEANQQEIIDEISKFLDCNVVKGKFLVDERFVEWAIPVPFPRTHPDSLLKAG